MKKNKKDKYVPYYRNPTCRQEAKFNCDVDHKKYVRYKRASNRFNDWWSDRPVFPEKSWKDKRKTQYHTNKRGKENSLEFAEGFCQAYDLIDYLKDHDIPYREDHINECGTYERIHYSKREKKLVPWYHTTFDFKEGKLIRQYHHQMGWKEVSYEVPCEPYITKHKYIKTNKIIVTWWYNKDIGLDHILRQNCRRWYCGCKR